MCWSVLQQDYLDISLFKSSASAARQHRRRSSLSTSQPHLHLNCHWFIDFLLRGWWAAPFIWTVFISSPRWLSLIKVKNQSCSVKLITSLLSPCHNHASSNKTVTGSSRITPQTSLSGSRPPFISLWMIKHCLLFLFVTFLVFLFSLSPKNVCLHVLFLAYAKKKKKKCFFSTCLPFLLLMQVVWILWTSQSNHRNTQTEIKQLCDGWSRSPCSGSVVSLRSDLGNRIRWKAAPWFLRSYPPCERWPQAVRDLRDSSRGLLPWW